MPPGSKNFPSTRFLGRCILNFVAMSFKTSRISSLNCTFKLQNLRMNEQIEHCKIDCVRRKIVKFSIFAIKFEDFDRNCSKISWPSTVIIIEWQSYCAMWNMWKILEIRFFELYVVLKHKILQRFEKKLLLHWSPKQLHITSLLFKGHPFCFDVNSVNSHVCRLQTQYFCNSAFYNSVVL